MKCAKCGAEINDGAKFCTNCGAPTGGETFADKVNDKIDTISDATTEQVRTAYNDVKDDLEGKPHVGRLETNRKLWLYIVLSIVTCGIYGYYFVYAIARDVNIACEGDGQKTGGLIRYIVLSFLTCGIYSLYWEYSLGNRLYENADKYGMKFQENGTTILMWYIFGFVVCAIGPFISMYILIKNTNRICDAYNQAHNL